MTLTLQLFKNSNDTREKLRLNFHSLSVSELLEYGRYSVENTNNIYSLMSKIASCMLKLPAVIFGGKCTPFTASFVTFCILYPHETRESL